MATYRMRAGDTLPKVAAKFQTTTQDLLKANKGLYRPTAGTTITVPKGDKPLGRSSFVVPASDEYYGFSLKQPITLNQPVWGNGQPVFGYSNPVPVTNNPGGLIPPPVVPGLSASTAWPPRPQITPIDPRAMYLSQFPSQGTAPMTQAGLMAMYAGRSTGSAYHGKQGLTPSQPQPTQQPVSALPTGQYTGDPNDPNTAAWKKYWDDSARAGRDLAGRNQGFPGFWGGGKNGQFYSTLREARMASRKRRQEQGVEVQQQQAQPVNVGNYQAQGNWRF